MLLKPKSLSLHLWCLFLTIIYYFKQNPFNLIFIFSYSYFLRRLQTLIFLWRCFMCHQLKFACIGSIKIDHKSFFRMAAAICCNFDKLYLYLYIFKLLDTYAKSMYMCMSVWVSANMYVCFKLHCKCWCKLQCALSLEGDVVKKLMFVELVAIAAARVEPALEFNLANCSKRIMSLKQHTLLHTQLSCAHTQAHAGKQEAMAGNWKMKRGSTRTILVPCSSNKAKNIKIQHGMNFVCILQMNPN